MFLLVVVISLLSWCSALRCSVVKMNYGAPAFEIEKRRNFAVISHPDAGKTTLTEKLLLYGDAIQEAGAVRARADRRKSTSDFLAMERERGISISSTCLTFEYGGARVNLIDTPGHADFSEDTYRSLSAADNAVMLIDGGKGLEDMTKKLFSVARRSRLPVFTFVNKFDRPAKSAWDIIDEIATEFHPLEPVIRLWPIGDGDRFKGCLDVENDEFVAYERGDGAGKKARALRVPATDVDGIAEALENDEELVAQFWEDREMIAELTPALDREKLMAGEQTAVFFGSAISNAGVDEFLHQFIDIGARPAPRRRLKDEGLVAPDTDEFSGFVFKLQANLDPRHRDCMAYVRVVSGKFSKGMKCTHSRTGRTITLSQATTLFGAGRDGVEEAFPGDVIGINNPAADKNGRLFAIGDALCSGNIRVEFEPIPSFSPERFAYLRPTAVGANQKAFSKGLTQMLSEGAVQLLTPRATTGEPILAAVGDLQFEVVVDRLAGEYGVETKLERLTYTIARWCRPNDSPEVAWAAVDKAKQAGALAAVFLASDRWERPVLLFRNEYNAQRLEADAELELDLQPWALPPSQS